MLRFFIVAGDPSGDRYGASLMKALRLLHTDCQFEGIGGPLMEFEGLKAIVPIETMSVVGFWEVLKRYSTLKAVLEQAKRLLSTQVFDAFIPIDYPGFNIRLATFAKSIGTPVCYYIAPQLWAWGKNRAKKLAAAVDILFVLFPFEVTFFEQYSIQTIFVGHPLLDYPEFSEDSLPHKERKKDIALFPGSRKQEIQQHLPLLIATASLLQKELPDHTFSFAQAPSTKLSIEKEIQDSSINFNFSTSRNLQTTSSIGLVKTGTTTLESFLLGLPYVMYYKTSFVSYSISKNLITLPYIALPNIIVNKTIVTERIQSKATPTILANDVLTLLHQDFEVLHSEQLKVKKLLFKQNGAANNVASFIVSLLAKK